MREQWVAWLGQILEPRMKGRRCLHLLGELIRGEGVLNVWSSERGGANVFVEDVHGVFKI